MHRTWRALAWVVHRLPLRGRLAESVRGRRAAGARWVRWAAESRRGPIVWFHAASVGEAAAVAPVARRLRAMHPDRQCVLTFSSPSMAAWPGSWPVDRADYVPLDAPGPLAAVFDALRPSLLCFSRGDLWPELVRAASARGVPVAVSGGVLRPTSARARWPGRSVLRGTHATPAWIGVCGAEDAVGWERAGARAGVVEITGDPRHDALLERAPDPTLREAVGSWAGGSPVLVAGSVERTDVEPLADALAALTVRGNARALVAPHDPDGPVGPALTARLAAHGVTASVWAGAGTRLPETPVVIVRALGLLADLYGTGRAAYVGGGFRRGGLHAVAEPAAAGVPVVVGPSGGSQRDAARLIAAGGAVRAGGGSLPSVADAIGRWTGDGATAGVAGVAARGALDAGAAERTAERLAALMA